MTRTIVAVEELGIAFGERRILDAVSFTLEPGTTFGLMGPSGSGKSLLLRALLGLLPSSASVRGRVQVYVGDGAPFDLLTASARRRRAYRATTVGYVAQDPRGAFNPVRPVLRQILEVARTRRAPSSRRDAAALLRERCVALGFPDGPHLASAYPHQLSGGMLQRLALLMATEGSPAILLLDEPTTALDATVQARVLALLRRIADPGGARILVSHDGRVVRSMATIIRGLEAGRLTDAVPLESERPLALPDSAAACVLRSEGTRVGFRQRAVFTSRPTLWALDRVDLEVRAGRTLGLVGESGCGKTTLARCLVGFQTPTEGRVARAAEVFGTRRGLDPRIQMLFQDGGGALDPRWTLEASLREALPAALDDAASRIARVLEIVGLPPRLLGRSPRSLSGGERQRAALARVLLAEPRVLVLDEPVAAIDGPQRTVLLERLRRWQVEHDAAYVLISHDIDVVAQLSHRIAVLLGGRVLEEGPATLILEAPRHPYSQELLASRLSRADHQDRIGTSGAEVDSRRGCAYQVRCPLVRDRCRDELPSRVGTDDHTVACFALEDDTPSAGGPGRPSPSGR